MSGWDTARGFERSCSPKIPGIYDQHPVKQTGQVLAQSLFFFFFNDPCGSCPAQNILEPTLLSAYLTRDMLFIRFALQLFPQAADLQCSLENHSWNGCGVMGFAM